MVKQTSEPRVYSYIRFSTPEQIHGDSLRRQTEASEAWCEKKGLTLDSNLRIDDLGVSGFKGKNADVGALATFLQAVERGNVPKGSYLLVENLDRLSRDEVKQALARFLDLISSGVVIVTLNPEREFGKDVSDIDLVMAILEMSRAHGESQRKSELRGKRWQADRERMRTEGVAITKLCPAWMHKNGDRYELIPERAKIIRRIFKLRLEGISPTQICHELNDTATWKPKSRKRLPRGAAGGWTKSYLYKILNSRSVIGELQPRVNKYDSDTRRRCYVTDGEPIKGVYPPVVDEATFLAVQSKSKGKNSGGRTGRFANVLRGLVRCAYCGGAMHQISRGSLPNSYYLQCDRGRRKLGCRTNGLRYHAVEQAVLWNCHKLRPEDVLPSDNDRKSRVAALRASLDELKALKSDRESQIDNLTDQLSRMAIRTIRDKYEQRIVAIVEELRGIEGRLVEVEAALTDAERTSREFVDWQADVGRLIEVIRDDAAIDSRLRLNDHLKQYVVDIECFTTGFPAGSDEDEIGGYVANVLYDIKAGQELEAEAVGFVEWLTARRASREGSFVRLRFPSGLTRDLAIGPVASGIVAEKVGGKVQSVNHWPALDPLLKQYRREQKQSRQRG